MNHNEPILQIHCSVQINVFVPETFCLVFGFGSHSYLFLLRMKRCLKLVETDIVFEPWFSFVTGIPIPN